MNPSQNARSTIENYHLVILGSGEGFKYLGWTFGKRGERVEKYTSPHIDKLTEKLTSATAQTEYIEVKDVRYAYRRLGSGEAPPLVFLQHFRGMMDDCDRCVLVVNGFNDTMVPSINAYELARQLPNAQLILYPDAGQEPSFNTRSSS